MFQTTIPNINIHLKNIFDEGELDANSVIKDFLITAADGKNYRSKFYNLDMIISVGYRIKSNVATRFRQWATTHIKEYIVNWFVMGDERLKNPGLPFDYFEMHWAITGKTAAEIIAQRADSKKTIRVDGG